MITVRPAETHEAAAIARIWEAAWLDGHRGNVPDALIAARGSEYFAARAVDLLDDTLVAEESDVILGLVIVRDNELQQLMVSAQARGRGVGRLLIAAAEGLVAATTATEIWLAVVPGNQSARRFYEANGWSDLGDEVYHSSTLDGGKVAVPIRRYAKSLDR